MATPGEKLARSLEQLKGLQDQSVVAIKSSDLSRVHRERLLENGFIKEVIKGWYFATSFDNSTGESTSWFSSFWTFCARYLQERYGEEYCISAEQSLMLHAGSTVIPTQLIIRSAKGNNTLTQLIYNTSLFVMKSPLPIVAETTLINGVRAMRLESAIVHSLPSLFHKRPIDVRAALILVKDASQLLSILLTGGHSKIAGRLAGAYRNLAQDKIADDILKTMKAAGYDVRESDPFETPITLNLNLKEASPYANRIRLMWQTMRPIILDKFPKAPGFSGNEKATLAQIKEIYTTDAYHSLSIENYVVSAELIERVRSGGWNVTDNESDRKQKDAMAARGYWEAYTKVELSIHAILSGKNAGIIADADHGDWFRALFAPSVATGIIRPAELAGYRSNQVFISNSKHLPLSKDAVRDAMPILFKLLEEEKEASVRAVLGHFIFVYIHPYMDGNGRIGRFLMNVMLVSGGFPWTVIPVEERDRYMNALESASVNQDITPFAELIAGLVRASMDGKPTATI
ncbi:Fic family protein [Algoriphagus sp. C2-6-M1]|uniref:Fic family protein n=1 Tax=Algoriphagus persicinus TaxID=3108754 RepID=UPI002B3CAD14|nr:Fic family protein [Algoriphagus sp. C2-6-M1]MEB2780008.1 Fic family protein [Algoriphagus sp. C2-6-M1]